MVARKTEKADTRTFILELNNGNIRKVTVPTTWKLTYGSLVPYDKGQNATRGYEGGNNGNRGGVALRFYEGNKENLRVVFTDVKSFRDASMAVAERRTTVKRQVMQKATPNGAKNVEVEASVSEWVNPDAPESDVVGGEFLRIGTSDGE